MARPSAVVSFSGRASSASRLSSWPPGRAWPARQGSDNQRRRRSGDGGGDGSLAVVAAAAAAHDLPFICVPAGTRNHFALDVGVDRHDLPGALDAFSNAVERRIDTAEVNGRLFLNNVSLGVYGEAVQRPSYRDAKVRTLLETAQLHGAPAALAPARSSPRACCCAEVSLCEPTTSALRGLTRHCGVSRSFRRVPPSST